MLDFKYSAVCSVNSNTRYRVKFLNKTLIITFIFYSSKIIDLLVIRCPGYYLVPFFLQIYKQSVLLVKNVTQ